MLRSGTDVVTNVEIYPVSKLNLVIRKKKKSCTWNRNKNINMVHVDTDYTACRAYATAATRLT